MDTAMMRVLLPWLVLAIPAHALTIQWASGAPVIKGPDATTDFSVTVVPRTDAVSPTGPTPVTITDATYNQYVASGSHLAFDVAQGATTPQNAQTLSYSSITPSICSFTGLSAFYVAPGTCSIQVVGQTGTRIVSGPVASTGAYTYNMFTSFNTGTLAKNLSDYIDGLISGKTPTGIRTGTVLSSVVTAYFGTGTLNMYSANGGPGSGTVTRNSSVFTGTLDTSAISVYITNPWGIYDVGLLVSPRHIVFACHINGYFYGDGVSTNGNITWQDNSGGLHAANLLAHSQVVNTDVCVGLLDNAITGITPFSVLPANFRNYMPSISNGLPVIHGDHNLTFHVGEIYPWPVPPKTACAGNYCNSTLQMTNPKVTSRQPWWQMPFSSGSPQFAQIGGATVLLSAQHAQTAYTINDSPGVSDYITEINAAMSALCTANSVSPCYSLTQVSLAGFPSCGSGITGC